MYRKAGHDVRIGNSDSRGEGEKKKKQVKYRWKKKPSFSNLAKEPSSQVRDIQKPSGGPRGGAK